MNTNYCKNSSVSLILMKNYEDNETRHQCQALMINKDITQTNIKKNLEQIRN
ncbi:hypothetical protein [Paramaledivibacter caminithermalis]|jgi:hypothetical protein|uniref:Uncharacterized protein n=1 Tax=Paramaledivibacter caminithermalis (strain DSM 15212 / CIP 107654 / DViRD3) TaxID=1121301 RepID=A0A1M6Q290_PARC5|nr:hypothetical protein [Paramaledivibacter caminithermalis]SHK14231.1 hypothetical protein SAMN02745912_02392 [Paramaledivibacter caminithermalis DSM 15212]